MLNGYRNARLQAVGCQQLIERFGGAPGVCFTEMLVGSST